VKPKVRKQFVYHFAQTNKDAAEIKEELLRLLKLDSRVAYITNVIKLLRNKYKPCLKKIRHWFHFTPKYRSIPQKIKIRNGSPHKGHNEIPN